MKKLIIASGVLLAAALVICLVPLKEVAYTVAVDYEDIETYYEYEPYEDIETFTETVPLDYEVVEAYLSSDIQWEGQGVVPPSIPVVPVCCAQVRNIDTVPGTFDVHFSFVVNHISIAAASIRFWSEEYEGREELYLKPGETKTVKHCFDEVNLNELKRSDDFSWGYKITPDTKMVEKQRTVTKYRQVEKERTVTKQRPEIRYKKVTLLDYFLHH